MQVTFLGTGASEGIPSIFCKCSVCENARKLKGKEIRTRMGVLIDDSLLIDFSPDIFTNAIRYELDFSRLKNIIVTHGHNDHCNVEDFQPRLLPDGEETFEPIHVYSNATVLSRLEKATSRNQVKLHELFYGETYMLGNYKVIPLRAIHMLSESAMLLLIEKDGKHYLHLSDTGVPGADLFELLKAKNIVLDGVTIDCTYGLIEREYFGHMNLNQVKSLCERLRANGSITEQTQIYITHICHWGGGHEILSEEAGKSGIRVAFDGLKFEI